MASTAPAPTRDVATPRIATPRIATPGIATPGIATPGIATPGIATPGIATPRIAEGGMGYIELVARHEGRFSRLFARKRLHPDLRTDSTFRAIFLDEARLSGLIRHANVSTVLDVGEDEEGPFLLMEYVDGVSVAQVLERVEPLGRPLPLGFCVSVVAQAARRLHAAHQLVSPDGTPLGVVHRDISPKNLLLGYDGGLRVADFGIAKAKDNDHVEQTRVGVFKRSIGYMAPEYLRFQEVDQRSDLFALGVVLFELLTRERLYGGNDPSAIARRILEEPPPDVFERRYVPPRLSALFCDLLAKKRELRPANALAVACQLELIGASLATVDGPFDMPTFLERELRQLRSQQRAVVDALLSDTAPASAERVAAPPPAGLDAGSDPNAPVAQAETIMGFGSAAAHEIARRAALLAGLAIGALVMLGLALWPSEWGGARVPFEPGAAALWGGGRHNCALRDGRLVCWGSNQRGQLGDGTWESRNAPVLVNIGPVRTAALGEYHSCALTADGRVSCWGRNTRGELGRRAPRLIERPLEVPGLGAATALASGRQHVCALLAGGKVSCWGANESGQLGRPPSEAIEAPGEVPDLPPVVQIFAGGANTCARLVEGELVCWGADESGQLGDGARENRATPTPLAGAEDFVGLAIGNNARAGSQNRDRGRLASFVCAPSRRGSVWCWGNNDTGQLGDGTREHRAAPVAVIGITDAIEVAAGDVHACALHRSGAVSCWGRNEFAAVDADALGPSTVRTTAVDAFEIRDAVGLALGGAHSCVRRRSGGVSCWGINNFGQLGDGSTLLRSALTVTHGFD
jgi:eukaryotic-like serine/threonine-protein kinase